MRPKMRLTKRGDDENTLSDDDIEAMFGDDEEPEPLGSLVDDETDDDGEGLAPDDLEEPEPIPQVFTADDTGDDDFDDDDEDEGEDESRGSIIKIIAAVVVAVVIGLGGGALFLRDTVISMIPATEGIYSAIGLADDSLGAGLSIKDVKSTRENIAGNDALVVRGVVANISDRERPVPALELQLTDLEGNIVQTATTVPLKTSLTTGDQIGFKFQVDKPNSFAQRIKVTFQEAKEGAAQ